MANSYKLPDDLSQVNYSSTDLLMYSRNGNPNQHWLEEKIAALHEADDAIVLASGVAALHALFWTLLKSGDRVIYPKVSYMAVYRLFHELFNKKFGVETVMVDMKTYAEPNKTISEFFRIKFDSFIITWLRKNQALIVTERNGKCNNFECCTKFFYCFIISIHTKRNNAAVTVLHLSFCKLVSRIAYKSRIRNKSNIRLFFKPLCNNLRRFVILSIILDTILKKLKAEPE